MEETRILAALDQYLSSHLPTIKDEADTDEPEQTLSTIAPVPSPSTCPIGNVTADNPDFGSLLAVSLPPGLELGLPRPVGLSPDAARFVAARGKAMAELDGDHGTMAAIMAPRDQVEGLLVDGAINLARIAGLSETLIGLTIVAIGTSMPELVTSVVAARKGQPEVAFGNVVGSNIYNLLGIGGATMLMAPGAVPAGLLPLDIGLVVASAVVILFLTAARGVSRQPAFALLAAYAGYLGFLVLTA